MRQLIIIIVASVFGACSKTGEEKDPFVTCIDNSWLAQQKASLTNCTCLTGIYQGTYLGQPVVEIRIIDPLCNGINVVYKPDGTTILHSGDQAAYESYLSTAKNLQLIWSCTK